MNRLLPFALLLGWAVYANAQSLSQLGINSSGRYVETSPDTLRLSYSLGEPVITPFIPGGNAGFQQPWLANLSQLAATDSVWPGDANDDGIANNIDLLAIGLGYGTTGSGRPNASLTWIGQAAQPWIQSLPTANYKHLDCDGNSQIDAADTLGIQQNYGLTHAQKTQRTDGIPIWLRWDDDAPEIGDTLRGEILFGVDTLPVDHGYGVAFSLEIDTALFDLASLQISYDNNWLGEVGNDAISLTRVLPELLRADMAVTRIDQEEVVGFGRVASLTIIMIDDLAGKQDSLLNAISLINPYAVDGVGTEVPLTPFFEPLTVNTQTHIHPHLPEGLSLYPNPASSQTLLKTPYDWQGTYFLRDVEGRALRLGLFENAPVKLDVTRLPEGVYFVEVRTTSKRFTLPLQVQH